MLKTRIKYIAAGILIVLATGCSMLQPKYTAPTIDTPVAWDTHHTHAMVESGVNLSDTAWWSRFNSEQLNTLIESALAHNNMLQMAIANINVAKAQLEQVHMSWVPTISLGGTAGIGQALNFNPGVSGAAAGLMPSGNQSFNFYGAGLVPDYSFNIFALTREADAARANIAVQEYAKNATRLAIISQVAGSYFTRLALAQQLAQQQALIRDLASMVKFSKIQYKNGYIALPIVETYKLQLDSARMEIPTIKNNMIATDNALAVLINQNPGSVGMQESINFASIKLLGIIPNSLPSETLKHRPDIMQAEAGLKLANANIGVASAHFFPSIDITTPVGAFNSAFGNLFNPSGDFWTTQITAVMPILNLGLYSLVKEKKAEYYVAYYNYIQTVKTAFSGVDDAFAELERANRTYALALQLFHVSYTNYFLAQKNYQLGYAAYSDILPSKIDVDKASLILTHAKLLQMQALIGLYQQLAGGYAHNM